MRLGLQGVFVGIKKWDEIMEGFESQVKEFGFTPGSVTCKCGFS